MNLFTAACRQFFPPDAQDKVFCVIFSSLVVENYAVGRIIRLGLSRTFASQFVHNLVDFHPKVGFHMMHGTVRAPSYGVDVAKNLKFQVRRRFQRLQLHHHAQTVS